MMELTVDPTGALVAKTGDAAHPARLLDDVTAVFCGQVVRLQVELTTPTQTRPGGEFVDVAARVVDVATPDGPTGLPAPVAPGLSFRCEPVRTSLAASFDDELPVPDAVDFDAYQGGGEPTGVVGNLKEMQLAEIVQTLAHAAKDAFIEVKPKDGGHGRVHVERGQVVHAECGPLQGAEAFYALLPADRGLFRIRYGQRGTERTIVGDTTFLLLEAARRADERSHAPEPVETPLSIDAAAADLLDDLDRLARDVAFAASASVVDSVDVMLDGVLDRGADSVVERPAHPAASPFRRFFDEAGIEPSPSSFEGGGGFFTSLRVDVNDDPSAIDSQATARVRRRAAGLRSDPPGP